MANNTTASTVNVDPELNTVEVVILILSCVIAVISNIFVLYLILTVRRLKTVTNVFVFSICMCNIMFALVLLPMHCFFITSPAYGFVVIITIMVYICNLTAVSYDRLVSITKPMLYTLKQTKAKAIKIVIVMWILPLGYCLLPLIWFHGSQHMQAKLIHKIYTTTTLVVFLLGPLLFIIFVYVKVCLEMKKMHTFKKKTLTPTKSLFKRNILSKTKGKRLSELRKLPQAILNNMRQRPAEPAQNGTGEHGKQKFKTIPSKLFYNVTNRESISLNNTESKNQKSSNLPDITLNATPPKFEEEQTKNVQNDVASVGDSRVVGVPAVTFVSIPDANESNITCKLLIKASLGRPDVECPSVSEYSAVEDEDEDDSDADTVSVNSRRNCSLSEVPSSVTSPMRKRASSIANLKRKAYELKASLAFLIVAITYMFTWLPVVALTFNDILDYPVELPPSLAVMSLYAIALNALSDPFLYGLLLPNFRKTLKIMLRRLKTRVN